MTQRSAVTHRHRYIKIDSRIIASVHDCLINIALYITRDMSAWNKELIYWRQNVRLQFSCLTIEVQGNNMSHSQAKHRRLGFEYDWGCIQETILRYFLKVFWYKLLIKQLIQLIHTFTRIKIKFVEGKEGSIGKVLTKLHWITNYPR